MIPLLLVVGCSDNSDLEARLEAENASLKEVTQTSTLATTSSTPVAVTQTTTPSKPEPPTVNLVEASFATTPSLEIECGNTTNQTTVAVPEGAGVWSQIRGDRALTGKSELIGSIICPRTLWTYDLAAQVSLIQLEFDAGNSANLKLPDNGSYGDRWNAYKTFEVQG
ncbi:MAG: hypothetical protein P8J64_03210, partial [Dehalococcoidia bacterium]|nr:hypothetical protein [Dehalococcoidia bacterium]